MKWTYGREEDEQKRDEPERGPTFNSFLGFRNMRGNPGKTNK